MFIMTLLLLRYICTKCFVNFPPDIFIKKNLHFFLYFVFAHQHLHFSGLSGVSGHGHLLQSLLFNTTVLFN